MSDTRSDLCIWRMAASSCLVLAASLLLMASPQALAETANSEQEIDVRGMSLAAACVTCHGGAEPVKNDDVRALAGAPADVLVDKMKQFAEEADKGSLMGQIARGYDEESLRAIAHWYEQQGKETEK